MMRLVIEKELREIIGSTKFAVAFGVCSLLILLAFYVGATEYHTSVARYEASKKENLKQMEGVTDWLNVRDHRIFLPPQVLASLVAGVSNDIGRTTPVRGRGEVAPDDSRYNEEPVYAVFRFLDLEFIVVIVLSLFAVLFTYDGICGEKERGTLCLSFAGPLSRRTYMTGKLLGSFLALGVPLLIPLLLGALMLPIMGVPMTGDEWMRLALIVVAGLLYFGAFLTLGIAVSALTLRSSNAFLILLVVWISAVLIIPRGAVLLAGRAVEVPSVDEIGAKTARFTQQQWAEDRAKMSQFQSTGEPQQAIAQFQKFMGDIAENRQKKIDELSSRLHEERANKQAVQEALAFGIARISPTASFSLAATTLAGTSLDLKERYRNAALEYQDMFAKFVLGKTGVNPGSGMVLRVVVGDGEKPKAIDPQETPPFIYQPATLADVASAGLTDLGVLALFCLVFFAIAHAAFVRYDLR
jgi:ABC-type transport system involved in multi-copper enzyme maturation permease subunit